MVESEIQNSLTFSYDRVQKISINWFIFHELKKNNFSTSADKFVINSFKKVRLIESNKEFFEKIFWEVLKKGGYYQFKGAIPEVIQNFSEQDVSDTDALADLSVSLTEDFCKSHNNAQGNVNDGVLILSKANVEYKLDDSIESVNLVFLLKIDSSTAISYEVIEVDGDKEVKLKNNTTSITESQKHIQKVAIISTRREFNWGVIAKDRSSIYIPAYFSNFLNVALDAEYGRTLTKKVLTGVRSAVRTIKRAEELDEDVKKIDFNRKARICLLANSHFQEDSFIEAVCDEVSEENRGVVSGCFKQALRDQAVLGQEFEVDRMSVYRLDKKFKTPWLAINWNSDEIKIERSDEGNGKSKLIIQVPTTDLGNENFN